MIQPGAFGDILICAPIARAYVDRGYRVIWPVCKKYASHLEAVAGSYVEIYHMGDYFGEGDWLKWASDTARNFAKEYEFETLDLSDRDGHPKQLPGETFEETKYRLADVPFVYKNALEFDRDPSAEEAIERVVGIEGDYTLVHRESSDGNKAPIPDDCKYRIIEISKIGNYNITDWYSVILGAKEIMCVESSVFCFVDGILHALKCKPILLPRPGHPKYTVSKGWDLRYWNEI